MNNSFAPDISSAEKKVPFRTPLAPKAGIKDFWRDFILHKKYLLLCFAVPALLTLLMYFCFQVYPIGEASVLVLDLNGQYVYFFDGFRDIITEGGTLLYSFSRALGGEFIGLFAYYLSSPFSFIVALFPKESITEALLVMFLLKAGACGLTFGIYIEATRKRNRVSTVIFSTMYALCGFAVVMQHNTMWTDNLILLPIVMLGIENLIKYGKFRMLVISLAMAIISNFYIGYMTCIFVFIYYFYFYFSSTPEERNPRGEKLHFIRSSLRMTVYCVIALAICAVLLLCTYHGLTFGKTTFSNPQFVTTQKFDWMDLITKLFIGSYDTVRPEGLPFLYTGTLTLMLLPLYFYAPHIKVREKISSGILIVVFIASFNLSTVDLFWHGLQRPNWLNYRYAFILSFFLVLFAYKAFERLREIGYKRLVPVCAYIALVLIIIQKEAYGNVESFFTVWLSLAIMAIYLCILRAVTHAKKHVARPGALVLAILVCTEMFGAGLLNMNSLGLDVVYSTRTSYRTFIDGLTPSVNAIKESDPSFYRMEKTHHRKTNDNFSLGINGLSNSTSTLNSETIKLLNSFGLSSKSHWSKYLGGTPVLDTLFGLKYVITKVQDAEVMELYTETNLGSDGYTVWQNPYAMSLAAGVSKDLSKISLDDYISPMELMNATVTAMLGEKEPVQVFRPAECDLNATCDNAAHTTIAGHSKYAPANSTYTSRFTYNVEIDSEDVLYLFIPTEYPRECYLYINGLKRGSYFGNETDRIVEIGSFDVGDTVSVTLEITGECAYLQQTDYYFYYLDSEVCAEKLPLLSTSSFMIHEYTDDRFMGTIDIEKGDELVYTSIPYDSGWKVYCDGKAVETVKILDGLVGFILSEGEHVLELKYRPDYLYTGWLITGCGLLAFLCACLLEIYLRNRKLFAGVPVYVIPDRGDAKDDILPALPDPDSFESAADDSISADEEHSDSAVAKYAFAPLEKSPRELPEMPPRLPDMTNDSREAENPCSSSDTESPAPMCENCANAVFLPDTNLLCHKCGIVPLKHKCKYFTPKTK